MYDVIGSLLQNLSNRTGRAVIVSIDGLTVSIRVGASQTVLREVRVSGDINSLSVGQTVPVIWINDLDSKGQTPIVLAVGVANSEAPNVASGDIHADEVTITEQAGTLSVKESGVGQKHLDFAPALAGHTHPDPLTDAGWKLTSDGILYAGDLYLHPQGMISLGQSPDVVKIDSKDPYYRMWAGDVDPELANFVLGKDGWVFIKEYVETKMLDLELMKMQFQGISWAQFAIFDSFDDESKRESPEPGAYPARVLHGKVDNGGDTTPDRAFTFTSKTFSSFTTVASGSSTSVGNGFLEDGGAAWFTDQWKGYELVDSAGGVFDIAGNTNVRLSVTGGSAGYIYTPLGLLLALTREIQTGGSAPASGAYSIRAKLPGYLVGFCSYQDNTNGGYGQVKLEVSFNGGSSWQTLLDAGINRLNGVQAISGQGRDARFRLTLTNDGNGNGAAVHKLLFCTDPSIWP